MLIPDTLDQPLEKLDPIFDTDGRHTSHTYHNINTRNNGKKKAVVVVELCAQPVHVLEKAVESTTLVKMCAERRMFDKQDGYTEWIHGRSEEWSDCWSGLIDIWMDGGLIRKD